MATNGFYLNGHLPAHTTLLTFCPDMVQTKLTGYSSRGIPIEKATDTYVLATEDQYINAGALPKYYKFAKE